MLFCIKQLTLVIDRSVTCFGQLHVNFTAASRKGRQLLGRE